MVLVYFKSSSSIRTSSRRSFVGPQDPPDGPMVKVHKVDEALSPGDMQRRFDLGGWLQIGPPLFWSTIDLEYKRVPQSKLAL